MSVWSIVSWIPEKISGFLISQFINLGLAENLANRYTSFLYWLVILVIIYLTLSFAEKINWIVKILIFILLGIMIIGFFFPF